MKLCCIVLGRAAFFVMKLCCIVLGSAALGDEVVLYCMIASSLEIISTKHLKSIIIYLQLIRFTTFSFRFFIS